jgi:flagellar assembly factor FliW
MRHRICGGLTLSTTIKTTRFGEIVVQDEDALHLPQGLIGFPELRKYVLLDHGAESPFKWMQSLDDGAIAFVLINPLLFKPDYVVEVSETDVADLKLEKEEDAIISVIVTMPSNPENMTANLKAPLVFNLQNRQGMQLVLSGSQYTTRHNILEEVNKNSKDVGDEVKQSIEAERIKAEARSQTTGIASAAGTK